MIQASVLAIDSVNKIADYFETLSGNKLSGDSKYEISVILSNLVKTAYKESEICTLQTVISRVIDIKDYAIETR